MSTARAQNFYDYAGQDPINGYDLNGESACSNGSFLDQLGLCHPLREIEHPVAFLEANGRGFAKAGRYIWTFNAGDFYKRHKEAISCGLFVAGVGLGVGELYVGTREAQGFLAILREGKTIAGAVGKGGLERVGAVGTASGLSFAANIATGGCSALAGW